MLITLSERSNLIYDQVVMSVKSDWMIHILHTILMWFIVIKLMNNYLPKELLQLISIIDKYILLNAGVF